MYELIKFLKLTPFATNCENFRLFASTLTTFLLSTPVSVSLCGATYVLISY